MSGNNLNRARTNANDEFYTKIDDIVDELFEYREHFKGKHVFMNADDPEESNFWRYFKGQFEFLGLKKITSTHYDDSKPTYRLDYDGQNTIKTPLEQNGDFRSPEAIEILKEADIVVTNPPFSLFREYINQLIEYNKDFIIMGNNNAVTYKEVFPLIKNEKVWLGVHSNKTMEFRIPDDYEKWNRIDEDGNKYGKVPAISWFTNLEHNRRKEDLDIFREFDEIHYHKYDNYDAINVDRVADIPIDYSGIMGVPITFLTKHNPNQFDIIWLASGHTNTSMPEEIKEFTKYNNDIKSQHGTSGYGIVDGKQKYHRILIQQTQKGEI